MQLKINVSHDKFKIGIITKYKLYMNYINYKLQKCIGSEKLSVVTQNRPLGFLFCKNHYSLTTLLTRGQINIRLKFFIIIAVS